MSRRRLIGFALLCAASAAWGQSVEINRTNRTIAVTATAEASADAEVAVVKIGYHNTNQNKDLAFRENARVGNEIINALTSASVSKEAIQTANLELKKVEPEEEKQGVPKKPVQYEAHQTWEIRVSAGDVQRVTDLAVRGGANEVEDVEWNVVDPVALEVKAYEAALARARKVAEQMAKGLDVKLGELVYASNDSQNYGFINLYAGAVGGGGGGGGNRLKAESNLVIFPQKVKREAKVHAVFAIQ